MASLQVCGALSLSSIRGIVQNFKPDSNAPDPVPGIVWTVLNDEVRYSIVLSCIV